MGMGQKRYTIFHSCTTFNITVNLLFAKTKLVQIKRIHTQFCIIYVFCNWHQDGQEYKGGIGKCVVGNKGEIGVWTQHAHIANYNYFGPSIRTTSAC